MKNFGLENLTDKELLGQLLCLEISGCKDRDEIISIIKENMTLKRQKLFKLTAAQKAFGYSHDGQIASVVVLESDNPAAFEAGAVNEFGNDLAMHIAAFHPRFIDENSVTQKFKDDQMEVFAAQSENLNKPADVLQKIMAGKLNKIYSEVCLTKQPFVKDDKMTVGDLLTHKIATIGEKIEIKRFTRYQI